MKKSINILIVEDEALIADHLAISLENLNYFIVGITDNATDTFDILKEEKIDLVLLDVNLIGDLSGIDIAHHINNKYNIPFIYITSNTDNKTIEKLKITQPLGFIVKPFQEEDLKPIIDIAYFNWQNKKNKKLQSLEEQKNHIYIKDKHQLIKLEFNNILFIEALDNYCKIFTNNKKYVLSKTLKSVFEKLPDSIFLKTHRSFVVNYNCIDLILPKAVVIKDKEIPLSENGRKLLMEKIDSF